MTTLKDITWDYHKMAERQEFVKVLMSGRINPKFYATYLFNQWTKYSLLEDFIAMNLPHAVDVLERVQRRERIHEDFKELWEDLGSPPPLLKSTDDFIQRIVEIIHIKEKPELLLGYMYVLHMGDLSGGQAIARRVPGEATMYKFNEDIESLKDKVRALTSSRTAMIADEAVFCFENSTKLFQELMELDIEPYMESSD